MNVKRRTPKTDLVKTAILRRMYPILDGVSKALSEELGVDTADVDAKLTEFAEISSRVTFDDDEVDFPLATAQDTPEEIREKFDTYLESECMDVLDQVGVTMWRMDRPVDPDTGPKPPAEGQKKA